MNDSKANYEKMLNAAKQISSHIQFDDLYNYVINDLTILNVDASNYILLRNGWCQAPGNTK